MLFLHAQSSGAQNVAARAEELLRQGQTVQAEELLRQALMANPDAVPVRVVYGELFASRQRWAEAMAQYEAALRVSPAERPAHEGERKAVVALALHQKATADADGALATLQHGRAVLPDDAEILTDLGIQAQSMGRLKLADEALHAALAVAPAELKARYALARVELDRQDFPAAEQDFNTYLRAKPEDATAHYGLGRVYQLRQRGTEAAAEFQRSIELQPVQTEAYYQLGDMALQQGQDAEARKQFETALGRMPAHGGALTGMGILAYRAKQYAAAEGWLRRAVTASPEYQPGHYYLGLTLRRLGKPAEAEEQLRVATELAARQQGKGEPVVAQ